MRCLEGAGHEVSVDAREIDQPGGGEELSSPYLDEGELDVKAWARDALALALPTQIVCSEDCLGLCAVCGENLKNDGLSYDVSLRRSCRNSLCKIRGIRTYFDLNL